MKPQLSAWVHRDVFTLRVPVDGQSTRWKRDQQLRRSTLERLEKEMIVRKILLPTDFSPVSARAAQRAFALGKQYNASITILHVIDVLTPCCTGNATGFMRQLRAEASQKMSQFSRSVSAVPPNVLITEGLPWEEIVSESENFDLLIIAKDGCPKAWTCFSQHTLQRVVEQASCPVLTIPEHASEELSLPANDSEAFPHPAAAA